MCVVLWVMNRLSLVDNAIVGICDPTFTKPLKGFPPEAWVGKSGNKATASKHHACWRGVHGFSGRIAGPPRARGRRNSPLSSGALSHIRVLKAWSLFKARQTNNRGRQRD